MWKLILVLPASTFNSLAMSASNFLKRLPRSYKTSSRWKDRTYQHWSSTSRMSCMKLFSYLPVWTQTFSSMCCVLTAVSRPAVLQFVQCKGKLQIQQAIKQANLQLYKRRVNQFKQFISQSQHNKQQKQARVFSFTTDNKLYFFSVAIVDRIVTAVRNSYFPLQWKTGQIKGFSFLYFERGERPEWKLS